MTPAELITRKLKQAIESAGATVPVISLLLEALEGEKHETGSSFIAITVQVSEQLEESIPHYRFEVSVAIVAAIDDDKSGGLFKTNHDAIWSVFDNFARGDNCTALGDEGDELAGGAAHIFAVDGFQLGAGNAPTFTDDEHGGSWSTSFAATITGRAN